MGGPPRVAPPYPVVSRFTWLDQGRGVRPATPHRRGRPPPNARGPRRRRSTRGDQAGLFLSRVTSGTEDFLTEGGTRGGVRSGPGRVERPLLKGTPRGADQGVVTPPPFCGSPGCWGYAYALPPPRLGRPVAWREVSRKARIDVLTVAVTAYNGGPAGGGGGHRADTESFFSSEIRHRPSEIRGYKGLQA